MQWQAIQTILGFAFGFAFAILGLLFIVLGLRARLVQVSTMSVRAWRIYLCLFGLGFVLLGFATIYQQISPHSGMSVAAASEISSNAHFVGDLFCVAGVIVWWLASNPSIVAHNGILRRVHEWIQGHGSLPEPPDQPPTLD